MDAIAEAPLLGLVHVPLAELLAREPDSTLNATLARLFDPDEPPPVCAFNSSL